MRRRRFVWLAPLILLGFLGFIAFGGWVVQQLWNWLLPQLFSWPTLTFWQALGLLALCRILFGGIGSGGSGRSRMGRRMAHRWQRLTPEERERLRQRMRQRWGVEPPASGGGGL